MKSIGLLALMVAVIAAQAPAVRRQWLEDRAGAIKTLRLFAYYFIYIAVGLALLLSTIRAGGASEAQALAAVGFMLSWIALGAGWLIKVVPRYRTVPAWLLRPVTVIDGAALAVIAVAVAVLFL